MTSFEYAGRDMVGHMNCNLTDTYKRGWTWDDGLINTLRRVITPLDVVLECDAHIGCHTLLLSPYVKKIYAVESYNETYNMLVHNTSDMKNIVPINSALSSENKETAINLISRIDPKGYGVIDDLHGVNIVADKPHAIITDTLESLTSRLSEPITVIKITNNAYNIIRTSEEYIKKHRPTFIIRNGYYEALIGSFFVDTIGNYESTSYNRYWTVYVSK